MFALVGKVVLAKAAVRFAEGYIASAQPEAYAKGSALAEKALDVAKAEVKGHTADMQATVKRVKRKYETAKAVRDTGKDLQDLFKQYNDLVKKSPTVTNPNLDDFRKGRS